MSVLFCLKPKPKRKSGLVFVLGLWSNVFLLPLNGFPVKIPLLFCVWECCSSTALCWRFQALIYLFSTQSMLICQSSQGWEVQDQCQHGQFKARLSLLLYRWLPSFPLCLVMQRQLWCLFRRTHSYGGSGLRTSLKRNCLLEAVPPELSLWGLGLHTLTWVSGDRNIWLVTTVAFMLVVQH